jgi:hypothetical protein
LYIEKAEDWEMGKEKKRDVLGRDISLAAWERLVGYELLVPVGIGGGGARDFGAGGRMWKVDVGLEEIAGAVESLSGPVKVGSSDQSWGGAETGRAPS